MIITYIIGLVLLLLPNLAGAHGIGEVYALPVPLKFYLTGAGLTVGLSFLISIFFLKQESASKGIKTYQTPWLKSVIFVVRLLTALFVLLSVVAGLFGNDDANRNFAPIFFWVFFLLGFAVINLFIGNFWDRVNPWKLLSDWLVGSDSATAKVSGFISVILLLALFWLELISGQSFVPKVVAFVLLSYTIINLVSAHFFSNWYEKGEVFSVFYGLVGRLAYFRITDDNRRLEFTSASDKLRGEQLPFWLLGIVSVLLAGATFDSLKETVVWFKWLNALGLSSLSLIPPSLGLVLAPLPFLAMYFLAIWFMKKLLGSKYKVKELAGQFAWSLIPIAFGYILAHNFSLFIVTAPKMLALVSDPLGWGWNLFGTAGLGNTNLILGAKFVWFIEIGLVILAHIIGIVYAHILAVNIIKDHKLIVKSQIPMGLLMVAFTITTLWLLSQPLTLQK